MGFGAYVHKRYRYYKFERGHVSALREQIRETRVLNEVLQEHSAVVTIDQGEAGVKYSVFGAIWRRSTFADKDAFQRQLEEALPEGTLMTGRRVPDGSFWEYDVIFALPHWISCISTEGLADGLTLFRPEDGLIDTLDIHVLSLQGRSTRELEELFPSSGAGGDYYDNLCVNEKVEADRIGKAIRCSELTRGRKAMRGFTTPAAMFKTTKADRRANVISAKSRLMF